MDIISQRLSGLKLGEATTYENLTVFPVVNGNGAGEGDYLTLDEAVTQGTARVVEATEEGRVPEVKFVNEGDRPVLLLDGEELIGAKQNRVINLTLLMPAHTTTTIPVSCVEARRWSRRTEAFAPSDHVQHASGRAMKTETVFASLSTEGRRTSDQRLVWEDIEHKARRMRTTSSTQAMADMFERYNQTIENYVKAFSALDHQIGAVFAINGEVIALELFDEERTMAKLFPKLLRSFALDAIDFRKEEVQQPTPQAAQRFIKAVAKARCERFPAVGLGEDVHISSEKVVGAALIVDGRVVHLLAFAHEGKSDRQPQHPRFSTIRSSRQR